MSNTKPDTTRRVARVTCRSVLAVMTSLAALARATAGDEPSAPLGPRSPVPGEVRSDRVPVATAESTAVEANDAAAADQKAENRRRARSAVVLLSIVVAIALTGLLLIIAAVAVRGILRRMAGPASADLDPSVLLPDVARAAEASQRAASEPESDSDSSQETVHT